MSQKERRHFSGEEKVRVLRQHLLDGSMRPVKDMVPIVGGYEWIAGL